jgi:DNA-binding winged helix-turn-helix (wHTH) protein
MPGKLPTTHFGSFTFDPKRQELTKRGLRIRMPASQLRLLTMFIERPGELITRDEIMSRLWVDTSNIDVSTGINTAIMRLRQNLGDLKDAPEYIETVIGLGYRFVAKVEDVSSPPTMASSTTAEQETIEAPAAQNTAIAGAGEAGFATLDLLATSPSIISATSSANGEVPSRPRRMTVTIALGCFFLLGVAGTAVLRSIRQRRLIASAASPTEPSSTSSKGSLTSWEGQPDKITAAAVSPNGKNVAYSSPAGDSLHWFQSGEQLFTSAPPIHVDHLSWFPDSLHLLMSGINDRTAKREVWDVPVLGNFPTFVLEDAERAVVSLDGTRIAFTRNQATEIWVADDSGRNPHKLTGNSSGKFTTILWGPSGGHLLVGYQSLSDRAIKIAGTRPNSPIAYEAIDATSGALLDREDNVPFTSGYVLSDGRLYFPIAPEAKLIAGETS